jgi:photosystem II stability/assembly factor-like uncharacterized protein
MKNLFFFLLILFSAITADTRWVQTNGPGGSTIKFLAKSSSAIFVATKDHGMFRSTDNGESWSAMHISGQQNDYIDVFASMGLTVFAVQAGSIFRSSDNGITWSETCASIGENIYIRALETNADYLFALSVDNGIFRSSDSGVSWTAVNDGIDTINSIKSIAIMGNIIFISGTKHVSGGYNHAVFRSLNNGTTWSPSDSGIPDQTGIYRLTVSGSDIIATTNRVDF